MDIWLTPYIKYWSANLIASSMFWLESVIKHVCYFEFGTLTINFLGINSFNFGFLFFLMSIITKSSFFTDYFYDLPSKSFSSFKSSIKYFVK